NPLYLTMTCSPRYVSFGKSLGKAGETCGIPLPLRSFPMASSSWTSNTSRQASDASMGCGFVIQLGHPKISQTVRPRFRRLSDVFLQLFREHEESAYLFWHAIPLRIRYR